MLELGSARYRRIKLYPPDRLALLEHNMAIGNNVNLSLSLSVQLCK